MRLIAVPNGFVFQVLIHGTHDEPEVRERGMAIPPGQEIFVAVTAEETYTTGT